MIASANWAAVGALATAAGVAVVILGALGRWAYTSLIAAAAKPATKADENRSVIDDNNRLLKQVRFLALVPAALTVAVVAGRAIWRLGRRDGQRSTPSG